MFADVARNGSRIGVESPAGGETHDDSNVFAPVKIVRRRRHQKRGNENGAHRQARQFPKHQYKPPSTWSN
jgi:hypothetical protein